MTQNNTIEYEPQSVISKLQVADSELYAIPKRGQYNFKDVPLDDPRVWNLFAKGNCKGIFQLEKQLGQDWSKRLKPKNIEELAALISLIRPGCLESEMSEEYAKRKSGESPVEYFHPALEPILKDTLGILIFQESCIRIARDIAGFTEEEADTLRKGIGKKNVEIIAKCKKDFVEKAAKKGIVTKSEAEEIFSWIEKFQRYGFNKCLTPDSIVQTQNGYKQLSDVVIGDKILAPSDESIQDELVNVSDVIDTGQQDVYEVTLDSGKTIKCTSYHMFICEDGNKRTLIDIILENHKIMCQD